MSRSMPVQVESPAVGSLPLDKIRALDLDRFHARLRAGGSGTGGELLPRTVRPCPTVMSQTLDQARRWGVVARNVAADTTTPVGGSPTTRSANLAAVSYRAARRSSDQYRPP